MAKKMKKESSMIGLPPGTLVHIGEQKIEITQPHMPLKLQPGDHLLTMSGGGAGVGRPDERDPESVRSDVMNELVSFEMAKEVYKVVINPGTFEVDEAATRKLREKS